MNWKGSSETTREAFCFDLYMLYKPQHKKTVEKVFLQWFIGFSEGDCTFHTWFDGRRKRAGFTIDQKDPKVLLRLRTFLGFGQVVPLQHGTPDGETQTKGWRFQVWDQQGLVRLFCIFYGNLVLDKRHLRFEKWTTYLVFPPGFTIPESCSSQAQTNKISGSSLIGLNNAWLAGFWQADGGFSAWGSFDRKKPHIILRAFLTQRAEETALETISYLVEGKHKNLSQITNGQSETLYNRLEFASHQALPTLLVYFTNFPLVGDKRMTFLRFKRLWDARERVLTGDLVITEKSITKLKRLIAAVKKTK